MCMDRTNIEHFSMFISVVKCAHVHVPTYWYTAYNTTLECLVTRYTITQIK